MSKVNLFVPCCMDMYSPHVPQSVVEILESLGDTVNYVPEQTCCGRTLYFEGQNELAQGLLEKMVGDFAENLQEKVPVPIIFPTAACVGYIKKYAKKLLENTVEVRLLQTFLENLYEFTDYLVNVKGVTSLNNTFNHRVYYYKSCSARNLYRLNDEPEILLKHSLGITFLKSNLENHSCPGNGRFAITNPAVSDKLVYQIVEDAYANGAQYITSTDIDCLQHIEAYLDTLDMNIEVLHIAEILANKN